MDPTLLLPALLIIPLVWSMFGINAAVVAGSRSHGGCLWFDAGLLLGSPALQARCCGPRMMRPAGQSRRSSTLPVLRRGDSDGGGALPSLQQQCRCNGVTAGWLS